jgi:hypothetical protein
VVGLKEGKSARAILQAQKDVGLEPWVLAFDLLISKESRQAAEDLHKDFPAFRAVEGDTKSTLGNGLAKVLDGPLDLVYVDGQRDMQTILSDMANSFAYLRTGGLLVLVGFGEDKAQGAVNMAGMQFRREWGDCIPLLGECGLLLHVKR